MGKMWRTKMREDRVPVLRLGDRVSYPGEPGQLGTIVGGHAVRMVRRGRRIVGHRLMILWDDGDAEIDECTRCGRLDERVHGPVKVSRRPGGRWSAERCRRALAAAMANWERSTPDAP